MLGGTDEVCAQPYQRPSMAQDMAKGRRTEIELMNGFIAERGRSRRRRRADARDADRARCCASNAAKSRPGRKTCWSTPSHKATPSRPQPCYPSRVTPAQAGPTSANQTERPKPPPKKSPNAGPKSGAATTDAQETRTQTPPGPVASPPLRRTAPK